MKAGGRKLTVAMTALILGAVLAFLEKLTGDFTTIATVAVTAFAAANAYEHHAKQPQNGGGDA